VADAPIGGATWRTRAGVPIRNLWMLLVYASGLARFLESADVALDEDPADLPELLARLLIVVVERRLRRNLSRAYQPCEAVRTRVRGRIDWLRTEAEQQLSRGRIACRFEALTNDIPRNRLVRYALEVIGVRLSHEELARRCHLLAEDLARLGVSANPPSRAEITREQITRNDDDDRLMLFISRLALDLALPGEAVGDVRVPRLDRDEALLRKIFEQAVAGLYRYELHGQDGWTIHSQKRLHWPIESPTSRVIDLLPSMNADIILEKAPERRIVLDTKFTGMLTRHPYRGDSLKSAYLYQLFCYLRSQVGGGDHYADRAEGLLLHPVLDQEIDEAVTIQGHRIRFATVDLRRSSTEVRQRLLDLVAEPI